MSDNSLVDRGKALEDAFFARESSTLRQRLKDVQEAERRKEAFTKATGISDEAIIARLAALNIGLNTLAALTLVPVVWVAWADGHIDGKERSAVLSAAADAGLDKESASYQLLEQWLVKRPEPQLLAIWKDYMRALSSSMSSETKESLKLEILRRARRTAEAAGGFLGFGHKISAEEQAVLADLETTFSD